MNTSKTLFVEVKDMEKDGDQVWFRGSFPAVTKEIKKGNSLSGISLVKGKIGFTFNDEPEVEQPTIQEPKTEPVKPVDGLVEGQKLTEDDENYVVRHIKVLAQMDEMIPIIANKTGQTEDMIKKMIFVAGSNSLLEDLNKSFRESVKNDGNFFTKIFK